MNLSKTKLLYQTLNNFNTLKSLKKLSLQNRENSHKTRQFKIDKDAYQIANRNLEKFVIDLKITYSERT